MDKSLAHIDLNLLVALRTLLEERSVTKAAERLFVTQPAMSKTLQRLRDLFDDPLFTRSGRGLIPTPRAQQLEVPLTQALEYLESTVFGAEFDPSQAVADIHICAPEMFAISGVPMLASYLAEHAPGIFLQSRNLLDDYLELMTHGELDFTLYVNRDLSDEFAMFPITSQAPGVWLPATHPLAKQDEVSIGQLAGMPSVSVYLPGFSPTEMMKVRGVFESRGASLAATVQTTQLLIAIEIIQQRGAFMLGPSVLDNAVLANHNITSRPIADPELAEAIQLELVLVQHKRTLNSPLHRWLRERILETYAQIT